MPYKIVKRKGLYYVINKETGKIKNPHKGYKTHKEAVKFLRALYWAAGEK